MSNGTIVPNKITVSSEINVFEGKLGTSVLNKTRVSDENYTFEERINICVGRNYSSEEYKKLLFQVQGTVISSTRNDLFIRKKLLVPNTRN